MIGVAEAADWLCYHTYDSRRSNAGFPDVIAIRRGRLVAAELKTMTGKLAPEQRRWQQAFDGVLGVEAVVWRPTDLPAVERAFK